MSSNYYVAKFSKKYYYAFSDFLKVCFEQNDVCGRH